MISSLGLMCVIFYIIRTASKSNKTGTERYKHIITHIGFCSAPMFVLNVIDLCLLQFTFDNWLAHGTEVTIQFFGDWINVAETFIVILICVIALLGVVSLNLALWAVYWASTRKKALEEEIHVEHSEEATIEHVEDDTKNDDKVIDYYGC